MQSDILIRVIIFILGLFGFWVARHIHIHKKQNVPLVCPIKFDCNTVVHSDYSKFFNLNVEIWGMFYYAFLSVMYLFFIFSPNIIPFVLVNFLITLSFIAFLFSLYLIGVQIFILKKGCSWCIVSAFLCFCIFILTIFHYDFNFILNIFF